MAILCLLKLLFSMDSMKSSRVEEASAISLNLPFEKYVKRSLISLSNSSRVVANLTAKLAAVPLKELSILVMRTLIFLKQCLIHCWIKFSLLPKWYETADVATSAWLQMALTPTESIPFVAKSKIALCKILFLVSSKFCKKMP